MTMIAIMIMIKTTGDTDTTRPDALAPDTMIADTTDEVNPTDELGRIMTTIARRTTAMASGTVTTRIAVERNALARGAGRHIAKFASRNSIRGMSGNLRERRVLSLGITGGGLLLNSQ